jgi:hypothetical protein
MTVGVAESLQKVRDQNARWIQYQQRAVSAASGAKLNHDVPNEPPQDQYMDDEEWESVESYEEARSLLDKNDDETLQRAKSLAAYYRRCARPWAA